MPFRPDPFLKRFERLRMLRLRPMLGGVVAIASVAIAFAVRGGSPDLIEGIPYGPYFIAVALSAVVAGGRAGLLALILSVAANFVASPSTQSGSAGVIAAGLFVIIAGAQLVLIWLLNHAIDRIWSQAENISLMLELQPAGLIGVDGTGTITLVNSAVERQLGYGRDELIDRPIEQLVPPDARGLHTGLRSKYFEHPEQKMMGVGRDLSAVAKDGSLVPVEIGLNPVVHDGRAGALATIVDISERKELERRAQILAREVGHRARNLLAVVRALAMRKLPREGSAEFIATLETLSRTQEIFEGRTVAPLRAILEGELAGLSSEVTISGCEVLLTPSAGQDFSIVVHELATNALKYGALSVAGGAICVEGHEDQEKMFHFEWTEHGGPPIITPPDRTGFGRKVIEAIAKGLRARLNVAYLREGLRLELVVPMESITNVSEIANLSTKV